MTQQEYQSTNGVTELSAAELASKIRDGQLSAQEVTEAHINRIQAVNGKLNAVVIPLFDQARGEAAAADEMRQRGEQLGPLHGVPVTIKEQYRVANTQTTLGATNKIGNVYHGEGPLVTKLREAGAIILGKTNIIQTLAGWESDNRVYGRSNNPWNLDRSPGGSSGGEGAIIAARGSALGLAGDFGGSTRIPAHFCGLQGLKPTSGRLSNDDFPADLLSAGQEAIIPQPGPIARTVADLKLAMRLFAETSLSTTQDLVSPVEWPDPDKVQVQDLRIGMFTSSDYFPVAPAIRRAVEEAAEGLRSLGAVVEIFPPPDIWEAVRLFLGVNSADGGQGFRRLLGDEKPIQQVSGQFQAVWSPAPAVAVVKRLASARGQKHQVYLMDCLRPCSAEEYWHLVAECGGYRRRFLQALDEGGFDAILCPPAALPAVTHGGTEHLVPAFSYAFMYNVLGVPAGVVAATTIQPGEESDRQVGKDMADITAREVEEGSAGLPVGVQVVARYWREDIVLAVMAELEKHFRAQPFFPESPEVLI